MAGKKFIIEEEKLQVLMLYLQAPTSLQMMNLLNGLQEHVEPEEKTAEQTEEE